MVVDAGGGKPRSRRCSSCEISWPLSDAYQVCPGCKQLTWASPHHAPLSEAEARSLKNHLEFERYYRAHLERQGRAEIDLLTTGVT